jgi:DNA-binding NarL/FixJ family response regulator
LLVEDSETDRELFAAQLPTDGPLRCRMTFARTLAAALATLGNEKTDVIVLDLNLPDSTGLETCRNVHSAAPDVPIVVLTGMDDEELGVAAVAAGAQDYLVKGTYDDYLLARAIRFALKRAQHRRAESRQHGRPEKDAAVALRLDRLTPREREVCDLLVQGSTAKHVAVQLDISVQTVAKHRARILEKMNVNNDVELVRRILGRDRARG